MQDVIESPIIPDAVRRVLVLCLTVGAALIYGVLMGVAIYGTFSGTSRGLDNETAARTASLLSGLVGSVVTAGFSRSKRPSTVQLSTSHPMGGRAVTAWRTLEPDSLVKANLLGLSSFLGFATQPRASTPSRTTEDGPPVEAETSPFALWVAIFYFAIYFLVGVASLLTMLLIPQAPDMVVDAGWVWLGTLLSSGYSFFALNDKS